jgi:non-ribosomal peptide synthetase component F
MKRKSAYLPEKLANLTPEQRDLLLRRVQQRTAAREHKELESIHITPAARNPDAGRGDGELPLSFAQQRLGISRRMDTTLFMTLLAAWQTLLFRYSGQDDIAVGTPIAGRSHPEAERLIGCFINTLVLRADLAGNLTFRELLRQVREVALGAYAHQDLPFEMLVEALEPECNLGRTPLFQVMFALQNTPQPEVALADVRLLPLEQAGGSAKFELTLVLWETAAGPAGSIEYNSE